ncbi:MAG: hypothetical protein WD058_05260 [Dehalococcoidia bacterium]
MKRRLLTSTCVVAALVASGCMQVELSVELQDDGSGRLTTFFAFNRALLEEVSGDDVAAEELLAEGGIDPDALPEGATYEVVEDDDQVGARISVPFEASEDVPAEIDRAFSALGDEGGGITGDGGPFTAFSLLRTDDDGWHFEATTAETEEADELTALLLSDATFLFRLSLPGEVTESNADRVEDDGTLVWDIPLSGGPKTMQATSAPPDAGGPLLIVLAVAGVLALVALVGAALYWRTRREVPALDPDTPPPDAPPAV